LVSQLASRLGVTSRFAFTLAYTIVLAVRRHLHNKNLFTREPGIRLRLLAPSHRPYVSSNACMHSIVSVCCCLSGTDTASKHWAANHSWQFSQWMWNSNLSRDLPWTLTCPGCPSWLQIKSLTYDVWVSSVLTERRRPLTGSLSKLLAVESILLTK